MRCNDELMKAKKALAKKILKDFGFELEVAGCGCCGSPSFSLSFNGQIIFDGEESFDFSTKDESDEKVSL